MHYIVLYYMGMYGQICEIGFSLESGIKSISQLAVYVDGLLYEWWIQKVMSSYIFFGLKAEKIG